MIPRPDFDDELFRRLYGYAAAWVIALVAACAVYILIKRFG